MLPILLRKQYRQETFALSYT